MDGIEPATSKRLKGFIPYTIRNEFRVDFLNRTVRAGIARLDEDKFSRLSVRAVVADELVNKVEYVEAGFGLGNGYSLVYIGYNSPSRELTEQKRAACDERLGQAQEERAVSISERLRSVVINRTENEAGTYALEGGYMVRLVVDENSRRALLSQHESELISFLGAFQYNGEEVRGAILNSSNVVSVAYRETGAGRELIGVSICEMNEVPLDNGRGVIRLAEFTDTYVKEGHRHNNIHFGMQVGMLYFMLSRHPDYSLFSESNNENGAVINAAKINRDFGGLLRNHVEIEGNMKSLQVMYHGGASREAALEAFSSYSAFENLF